MEFPRITGTDNSAKGTSGEDLANQLRSKILGWMAEDLPVELDDFGGIVGRIDDEGMILVNVEMMDEQDSQTNTLVHINSPVLIGVPPSDQLFEWIAREQISFTFGRFCCVDDPESAGDMNLLCQHTLVGNNLEPEDFKITWLVMCLTAMEWAAGLKRLFGGLTFEEHQATLQAD